MKFKSRAGGVFKVRRFKENMTEEFEVIKTIRCLGLPLLISVSEMNTSKEHKRNKTGPDVYVQINVRTITFFASSHGLWIVLI